MKTWTKRYAIGFLLSLCVLSGIEAAEKPFNEVRFDSILTLAAVWPITVAIVAGSAVGVVAREGVSE